MFFGLVAMVVGMIRGDSWQKTAVYCVLAMGMIVSLWMIFYGLTAKPEPVAVLEKEVAVRIDEKTVAQMQAILAAEPGSVDISCLTDLAYCLRLEYAFRNAGWAIEQKASFNKGKLFPVGKTATVACRKENGETIPLQQVTGVNGMEITNGINVFFHKDSDGALKRNIALALDLLTKPHVFQGGYDDFLAKNHFWIIVGQD